MGITALPSADPVVDPVLRGNSSGEQGGPGRRADRDHPVAGMGYLVNADTLSCQEKVLYPLATRGRKGLLL